MAEIGQPRYGSYHIYLTNLLPKASVKQLAEADMQEVVKEIKEIYIDYLPIGDSYLLVTFKKICSNSCGKEKNYLLQAPTFLGSPYSTLSSPWEVGQFSKKMLPLINKTAPPHSWVEESLQRTSQALASLLLSLRLSPTIRLVGSNLKCV